MKTRIDGSLTHIIGSVKSFLTLCKQGAIICWHRKSIICLVRPVIWKRVGGFRLGTRKPGIYSPDPLIMSCALKIMQTPFGPLSLLPPAGQVLPQAGACCRQRHGVQAAVPHLHGARLAALVRQRGAGRSLYRWIYASERRGCGWRLLGDEVSRENRSPNVFLSNDTNKWCVDFTGRSSCCFCSLFFFLFCK